MRTASHPYNNRHRQAPSTHTDKQAVRTIGGEQCLIILVYTSSAKHPNKIGGFVVRGLFCSNMQCVSARIHTSKLNIFSQTIKVSDCFLQYAVFIWQNYTLKMPNLVSVKLFSYKLIQLAQVVIDIFIQVETIFLRTPKKTYFVREGVFVLLHIRHILGKAIKIVLKI